MNSRYLAVQVDADVLGVDGGPVLPSAGLAAGIGLQVQVLWAGETPPGVRFWGHVDGAGAGLVTTVAEARPRC